MVVGIFFGGIIFINFLCKMVEGKSDIIDEIFVVDDLFVLEELILFELFFRCFNIVMVLIKYGGYVGFIEGLFLRGVGLMEKVIV